MVTSTRETEATSEEPAFPSSLWRNRDYVVLWTGQVVSNLGDTIGGISIPLLILALTGSPAQAGISFALNGLPFAVLSLPAGALIDRWDRKRVMIFADMGRAVVSASIPVALWTGHLTIVQIYFTSLCFGTFSTFFNLSEMACLPNVVNKDQLPAATAQNIAGSQACFLIGPPIGGFLYSISKGLPMGIDAISYAASVISLRFIRTEFQQERKSESVTLRADIMEGLRWLWSHRVFRFLALMNGANNLLFVGNFLIVIVLARSQQASPTEIGVIFSLGSIGGLIGSFVGGRLQRKFRFGTIITGCFWVMAVAFPLEALAPNPFVLGANTGLLFFTFPIYNVSIFSYRLSVVPDELLGRVTSSVRLIATGFMPLGSLLTGTLLQLVGPRSTVLILSIGFLAVALAASLNPRLRQERGVLQVREATA